MASPLGAPAPPTTCSVCQTTGTGKFCSNCGSPLAGATCAACEAPLTPGAKFCHRCGTPARVGAIAPGLTDRSFDRALPWAVAGIALVALLALIAGQRFRATSASVSPTAQQETPLAPASSQPPDISALTPAEAAARLYNRVMGAHERGQEDTVRAFAPMAISAFQMLDALDPDQRYDLGRIASLAGDPVLAKAQADTILAFNKNHLLGLILAANAAHLRKDATAERDYYRRFTAAVPAERAKRLPEYVTHDNDITVALGIARRGATP
jgi:hypothetical protein